MTTLEVLEQGLRRVKVGWTVGQLTRVTNGVIEVCALGGLIPQDDYLRDPERLNEEGYACLLDGTRCTAVEQLSLAIQRLYPERAWDEARFRAAYITRSNEGDRDYPMSGIDAAAHRGHVVNFNDFRLENGSTAARRADIIAIYEEAIRFVKQPAEVLVRETELATSGD